MKALKLVKGKQFLLVFISFKKNSLHNGSQQSLTYPSYNSGYSSSSPLQLPNVPPNTPAQLNGGGATCHSRLPSAGDSPTPLDLLRALSLQADIPLQRAAVPASAYGQGLAGASVSTMHGNSGVGRYGCSPTLYNDFSLSADLFASRPWTALNTLCATSASDPYSIERAAKLYRNAASEFP